MRGIIPYTTMLWSFVLLRSKKLFSTVTMTMTIPFTITLIDEVGDFTIKTG
jgi:hypothetical protein